MDLDLHESQQCAGDGSEANHGPASHLNLLVGDADGEIPGQMSEAVQAVECEWQADEELGEELGGDGPCAKGSGDASALDVPTKGGGSQVCEAEEVKGTGKGNSSDTVQCRQVPGDLGLVDTEMRSDGAMKTLFGKDLSRCLIVRHGLSGGKSGVDDEHCHGPWETKPGSRTWHSIPPLVNDAGRCDDGGLAGSGHCSLLLAVLYCKCSSPIAITYPGAAIAERFFEQASLIAENRRLGYSQPQDVLEHEVHVGIETLSGIAAAIAIDQSEKTRR